MSATRFSPESVQRIGSQVRAAERRPAGGIPDRRASQTPQVRPASYFVVTTAIPARTGTSPNFTLGQGAGLMLWLANGVTSTSGETLTLYNGLDVAIPTGPDPVIFLLVDGHWCAAVGDCPTGGG